MNSTDVENQALNGLRDYIEYSPVIAQHLSEGDRDPLWDGYLYLYADGIKDNEHYIDKVSVQVKGKEVDHFKLEGFKYPIEKIALRAYLSDPVVFIVCQLKKNTKEKKLFYRSLLPENIKNLLKGKDKQETVSVLMKPMPEECEEFENILTAFIGDRRRQLQYAHVPSLPIEEVKKRNILQFQLSSPIKPMSGLETLQYISAHETFLYANIDPAYNITIPIDFGGECSLSFTAERDIEIKVGERVFFDHVESKIEKGLIKINAEDTLTLELKNIEDLLHTNIQVHIRADRLDKRLKEYEFVLALCKEKCINANGAIFNVNVDVFCDVEQMQKQYEYWKDVQRMLTQMHVAKPLLFSTIKPEHNRLLSLLVDSILYNHLVEFPSSDTGLHVMTVGNIHLLVWTSTDEKTQKCVIGDFFDGRIEIGFKMNDETVVASPFSYLRGKNLWSRIDNIPFDRQIDSMKSLKATHKQMCEMANGDVLAMIACADKLKKDDERYSILMDRALALCTWLEAEETDNELKVIHHLNQLQIYKRKRALTAEEMNWLRSVLKKKSVEKQVKLGVCALLEDKKAFNSYKAQLTPKELKYISSQPISKYFF